MDSSPQQAEIRSRKVNSLRRRDGLIKFAYDITSQNGEDGVLDRIFELCSLPSVDSGCCVDVGAWDGKHLSNTYSLLWRKNDESGDYGSEQLPKNANSKATDSKLSSTSASSTCGSSWKGILIEADENRFTDLSRLYEPKKETVCVNAAVSVEGENMWSNRSSLVSLLRDHAPQLSSDFDFLCIDIDGSDYWVMHDLLESEAYRPKVVCIEFNPTMPNDLIYIPPRSDAIRQGASLAALYELADRHSYTLVETTLFNAFFVRTDIYEACLTDEVPDTSIEALHESTMGTALYQLYDGTIKISGCKRMLWHRLPIDEQKLQMIPREARVFPFSPAIDAFDVYQAVDTSSYFATPTDAAAKQQCSSQLFQNLQSTGFCYVRGTTLPPAVCRAALASTHDFLEQADETVRRSCLTVDRARRGYSPINSENFASLVGEQGPNDLVRKFRIGAEGGEYNSLKQPNIWPSEDMWAGARSFRCNIEDYFRQIYHVAETIVQAICDGILLSDPSLKEALRPLMKVSSVKSNEITSILTLLGYRPGSRHKGKNKGPLVAPHTDVGVITVLLFENHPSSCARLQRSDGKGGWLDVTLPSTVPSDPIFVVNVADCFSELCRGKVSSTLHRVAACRSGTEPRSCLALFVGPDAKTELHMPTTTGTTMTYEEWRKRRIDQSQAILQASKSK